jgi:hypothetical protein
LDSAALSNRQAGVGVADAAQTAQNSPYIQMLQAEAMRRGIPIETLSQLTGILGPIAGLGGSSTGTGTMQGTHQMSGAQQFGLIAGGLGAMFGGGGRTAAGGGR